MLKFILLVFLSSTLFVSVQAYELGVSPSKLELKGESGEEICKTIAVFSKDYDGRMELKDEWSREYSLDADEYNISSREFGIEIDYDNNFFISEYKEMEICSEFYYGGEYNGMLFFRALEGNVEVLMPVHASVRGDRMPENVSIEQKENNKGITGYIIEGASRLSGRGFGYGWLILLSLIELIILSYLVIKLVRKV